MNAAPPASWLLLRGLMRDQRHWGDFPERLRAAFPGVPVHAIDFAGNGVRHRETSAARVAGMVADARAEAARLGLAPPYRVLAMSLGAMAAVAWAVAEPQAFHRCVLVNTSLRPFSPPHWRLRPTAWPGLLRLLAGAADADTIEREILRLTSNRPPLPGLAARWADWRRQHPVSRANALRQLAAAAGYRAPRQPPAVPLLIVNGAGDRLVDPRCSARLARAWGVPLAVHPEAGHDLPLDAPDWLIETLRASDEPVSRPAV